MQRGGRWAVLGLGVVAALLLATAACSGGGSRGATPTGLAPTASSGESGDHTSAPDGGRGLPSGSEPLVEKVRRDAAVRAGVDASQVSVSGVTTVDWPDSSLGCPKPGQTYAQVVTSGYRMYLKAGGKSFEYHTDKGSRVVYCENPQPPAGSGG